MAAVMSHVNTLFFTTPNNLLGMQFQQHSDEVVFHPPEINSVIEQVRPIL